MITVAVVGAGLRGDSHARELTSGGRARVVAVAEPDEERRRQFAGKYGISQDSTFAGWSDLADAGQRADAIVLATPDHLHAEPAVTFAGQGYHILLEKPMAGSASEARRIVEAVRSNGVVLAVCHVLRYTPYTAALINLLQEGRIGRLVGIQHLEPIGWWHFAHSYVRGNWRREDTSGPLLLTKSCHDIDWIMYLAGRPVVKVSSFGSLTHFRAENRPPGAAGLCLDCPVEHDCPYSAKRLYLNCLGNERTERWPLAAVTATPSEEAVISALRSGPYGKCVYDCDNDVVDHQVVNLEFSDGATADFTVTAFAPGNGHRRTRLFGTGGYIEGDGFRYVSSTSVTAASGPSTLRPDGTGPRQAVMAAETED